MANVRHPSAITAEIDRLARAGAEVQEVIDAFDTLIDAVPLVAVPPRTAGDVTPEELERSERARLDALNKVRAELAQLRARYAALRAAGRVAAADFLALVDGRAFAELATFDLSGQEEAERQIAWLYANILEFEALEATLDGHADAGTTPAG